MAPRFAFRASKFRNIECKPAARDACYDQLHVTTAAVEGNAVAATVDRFAFAHQIDGGAAIQVKALNETGKETAAIPPLLRGHQARVNALEFSPFDSSLLLSASADTTVKVWKLPNEATGEPSADATATLSAATSSVVSVKHHPTASAIVSAISHREVLVFDLETESVVFQTTLDAASDDAFSSVAWNYDGTTLLTSSLNQFVRLVDPRAPDETIVNEFKAHTGRRRPTSVAWCGRRDLFVTTGCDPMQERELKLWDPRNLDKPVHRERLDTSIGQLFPLYDADVDLLYVLGKGDRSVRAFEVDESGIHKLNQTLLPHMTLGAAFVPKQACITSQCEVARVLSLSANGGSSGGVCDVLPFTVPRKDALSEFQRDLYPDTLARTPALSAEQWKSGETAAPLLESVKPTQKSSGAASDGGLSSVFGSTARNGNSQPSSTAGPAAPWNPSPSPVKPSDASAPVPSGVWSQAAASPWGGAAASSTVSSPWNTASSSSGTTTSSGISGWASKSNAWNAPTPSAAPSVAAPTQPVQWFTPQTDVTTDANTGSNDDMDTTTEDNGSSSGATKNSRFATTQGHKLKYIKGKQGTRNDVLNLADKVAASNCIKANDSYMAIPLMGAGGPVLVTSIGATGRVTPDDTVLNGQKATVTDLSFHPFQSNILATGSSDTSIAIWNVENKEASDTPSLQLRGHTKSVRTVEFHPRAADVLCSTSQDLSIRLWDVETGAQRVCLSDKLEDSVWNAAFSPDGSLLATSSRARIVRVFDPRAHDGHVLVAMGCGFDSIRPQHVTWLSSTHILTMGTTGVPRQETELRIWDARSLVDPLLTTKIDSAAAESTPFYDASSRVLFLAGTGGRHVWSYEIGAADDGSSAVVNTNLPFIADGLAPISAAALLPKRLNDVRNVEIDRMLLLRGNTVERVSFSLPRNEKLRQYFQDDLYGDVPAQSPSLSAAQWFDGDDVVVEYESLRPSDMTPLSEKPEETNKPVPMSQQFRAKWEQEERDQKLKAENLERLQALASQPSLHSSHQHTTSKPADDSDDDWDD